MVEAIDIAAPIVAAVAFYGLYYVLGRSSLGADADWWEAVRRVLLPPLNRLARRNGWGYAAYTLDDDEYAGRLDLPPEKAELVLEALGFERMPLAAFKWAPDGRAEVGSWAYREGSPLTATRQDHVILFAVGSRADPHATDVYAHNEYNAFNPTTAVQHYLAIDYDPAQGVENVHQMFVGRSGHQFTTAGGQ